MFNIAEGINRGWAASGHLGTAENYYKTGILASWVSYGIPETGTYTAYFYQSGGPGFDAVYTAYPITVDFNTYYAQPVVKYAGNTAAGLAQILQEK